MVESYKRVRQSNCEYPLVLTAFRPVQHSRDGAAPFLQEANFLWLTGIDEPDWRCIITLDTFYLVAPEKDEVHRIFEGGISVEEAKRLSGADEVISSERAKDLLRELAEVYKTVYTLGEDPQREYYDFIENPAPATLRDELRGVFSDVKDCRSELAKLRAIKTDDEVRIMQGAIAVTSDAFEAVKQGLADGEFAHEYGVEARFTYEMRRHSADGHAYEPIVAGGKNALTLHYGKNSAALPKNGLVLMDIGARVRGYSADITRTYAVGVPSEREREVHGAVEAAHHAIIALIKPGVTFKAYQEEVDRIMKQALVGLGLLNTPEDYRRYFPHAISHGLGIDVHESLGGYDSLQPGMILTVEPGVYIPEEGIGVRIEDDILVTHDGSANLSASLSTSL